jgi:hypothetical protein
MTSAARLLNWLDRRSDNLSPLVVKEARQVVRGREFVFSFLISLIAGLVIAMGGASAALAGSSTSGRPTFAALIGCLAFLGLAVVPLGAFNTLRQERAEQTLELITLTTLSSRRIIVGKLLAQSVKLMTLFAALAPFLAMSFLLGGIDFTTILVALVVLYMGSVWAGAFCLFLSTVFKSRAASGLMFGAMGLVVLFLLFVGMTLFRAASLGLAMPAALGLGVDIAARIKEFSVLASFWLSTLANLVLLAENRLSLATEDTVTPLRIGLFVQFMLMIFWAFLLLFTSNRSDGPEVLSVLGTIHLALVSVFVVTEEMSVPRRVLLRIRGASSWSLLRLFGPGAGRGAAYILVQMAMLIGMLVICAATPADQRRLFASCGYICFFTGVPALAFWRFWRFEPARVTPFKLRVAVLCSVAAAMVLPDIIHYVIFQPDVLDLSFGARHLVNPLMTIRNWDVVESRGLVAIPFAIGVVGLFAYIVLIRVGARVTSHALRLEPAPPVVDGATARGSILN